MASVLDEAAFAQDAASGLFIPTQARRQVLPWEDLSILSPPDRWSQVAPDLLSTLAVLVAQDQNQGRLLKVDAAGDLRVGARVNAVTKLGAPLAALGTVAIVLDTSNFFPGDHVALIQNNAPTNVCVDVVVKSIDSPTQMTFVATCSSVGFGVGDFVVGEQTMNIRSIFEAVTLGGVNVNTAPGATGTLDGSVMTTTTVRNHKRLAVDAVRSVDVLKTSGQVSPGLALIDSSSFGAGFRVVLAWVEAAVLNTAAGATTPVLRVWDGNSGVGTPIFSTIMFAAATLGKDAIFRNDLNAKSSDNSKLVIDFDRGGAGIFEYINAGFYVEG